MTQVMTQQLRMLGIVAVVAVLAGCSNMMPAKDGSKVVRSMEETHKYLGTAAEELQATNAALDRAGTATDLKAWYAEYSKSVAKLQKGAEHARDHWYSMKANNQAYVDAWEKEIGETSNPEIKETMEQRRQRVTERFESVRQIAEKVRDSYQPYVKDLQDIETALKVDLTAGGVKALEPSISKAKADGDVVMKNLDELGIALDKMSGRMSPKKS